MAATEADASRANEILLLIEQDDSVAEWIRVEDPRQFDEALRPWVEIALTQLVLLLDGGTIEYAQATRSEGGAGRLIVYSDTMVAVSDVADPTATNAQPRTTTVRRDQIRSLSIAGGSRVIFEPDTFDNRRAVVTWPGNLTLDIEYAGLDGAVSVSGSSLHRWERSTPGPILALLSTLRADLSVGGRSAPAAS